MKPSNKAKKIYPAYRDGARILCSRCFGTLGNIAKYGHDDTGYWFVAPCHECGAKMKWYRLVDGQAETEAQTVEDGAFGLTMIDGELTMVWEDTGEQERKNNPR